MNKKKLFRWLKIFILIYCVLGIILYYLQDRILFHPVVLAPGQSYDFVQAHKEVNIPYGKDSRISIVQFIPPADSSKAVVLYFHGNRRNISWYAPNSTFFTRRGYECWMMDYPGFGKSTGKLSESNLYEWALQLYKLARARYKPGQIIIYGKSIGTGIAAELASVRDCRALVLESPYYSFSSLASTYLPIYPVEQMIHFKFPTGTYLKQVTAPVLIFHGTRDGVIPIRNSRRLIPALKSGDQYVPIDGGHHNDLPRFPLYQQKLDSLLER